MTPGDDDITSIFLLVVFFGCAQSTSVPNTQFSIDYLQYRLLFSLLCCSDVPRNKTISNKFRQLDLTDFMFQRHTKSLFSSCKSFQLFYLRINHYFLRFFFKHTRRMDYQKRHRKECTSQRLKVNDDVKTMKFGFDSRFLSVFL